MINNAKTWIFKDLVCTNLPNTDTGGWGSAGVSDPYFEIQACSHTIDSPITGPAYQCRNYQEVEGPERSDTLNPEWWGNIASFHEPYGEFFEIIIRDSDTIGSEFLGHMYVSPESRCGFTQSYGNCLNLAQNGANYCPNGFHSAACSFKQELIC